MKTEFNFIVKNDTHLFFAERLLNQHLEEKNSLTTDKAKDYNSRVTAELNSVIKYYKDKR